MFGSELPGGCTEECVRLKLTQATHRITFRPNTSALSLAAFCAYSPSISLWLPGARETVAHNAEV